MSHKTTDSNLEKIRSQIELLKLRLENINKTLNFQEDILNMLTENTKLLLKEATVTYSNPDSTCEIMRKAFSKGKIPKILFKS